MKRVMELINRKRRVVETNNEACEDYIIIYKSGSTIWELDNNGVIIERKVGNRNGFDKTNEFFMDYSSCNGNFTIRM